MSPGVPCGILLLQSGECEVEGVAALLARYRLLGFIQSIILPNRDRFTRNGHCCEIITLKSSKIALFRVEGASRQREWLHCCPDAVYQQDALCWIFINRPNDTELNSDIDIKILFSEVDSP